ncbi:MAG: aminomethyl-transferring glycine dehydrogenase subunit GcvPA [Candidatus Falkowbacteria bacterium]
MRYLPHTKKDISQMLGATGFKNLDELFSPIPEGCRRAEPLKLPATLNEWELGSLMEEMAGSMAAAPEYKMFIGAGSYDHHIPASVFYLLGRSEFTTSYTPYQPELSQGTLQAIYEYQTLVSRLLGMEVANASMYDGASALAEALLMSMRVTRRKRVAVSAATHPLYRRVIKTYLRPIGCEIVEIPYCADGALDMSALDGLGEVAAIAVQSPNFFGCVENLETAAERAHAQGALMVASFTEPIAYGLLKNPGDQGVDIACGEGQSLGIPRSFGGPGLGLFTSRLKYVRGMPGRLIGKTVDLEGKRGFVLTLATREQHIRREKATSNICTNSSLCALSALMFLASVGKTGLRNLAQLNRDKSEYLKAGLKKAGLTLPFAGATFNEFVARIPADAYERLLEKKIVAGLPIGPYYPELADCYVLCATETASRKDMDQIVKELAS